MNAIEVENISKEYRIGHKKAGSIMDVARGLLKKSEKGERSFLALTDVSFSVGEGEAIGIIGKNGAGKSTLLKILSRITYPTSGKVTIYGRVSSLLEVGTGFHPELTGRENIFLNGAILGMRRNEIRTKFDEMVAFSGVEKFIDTPIKHYSSGMKVRLAFSVAAHLEPEILIIDEVLAVGDADFQKKCLGKMEEVTGQGRTVLFVSHNMIAVELLCPKAIWIESGRVIQQGASESVISDYLQNGRDNMNQKSGVFKFDYEEMGGNWIHLFEAILSMDNEATTYFYPGSNFSVTLMYKHRKFTGNLKVGLVIRDKNENPILGINNQNIYGELFREKGDAGVIKITIPSLPIVKAGTYQADIYFGNNEQDFLILERKLFFSILESDVFGKGSPLNPSLNLLYCKEISFQHNAI